MKLLYPSVGLGVLMSMLIAMSAHAQQQATAPMAPATLAPAATQASNQEPVAGVLERLNDELAVLELQARIAKAKKDIAVEGGTPAPDAPAAIPAPANATPAPAASAEAPVSQQTLPWVRTIFGAGKDFTAELSFASGGGAFVGVGSRVNGVGKVLAISGEGVVVDSHGERLILPMAGVDPRPNQTAGTITQTAYGPAPRINPPAPFVQR